MGNWRMGRGHVGRWDDDDGMARWVYEIGPRLVRVWMYCILANRTKISRKGIWGVGRRQGGLSLVWELDKWL